MSPGFSQGKDLSNILAGSHCVVGLRRQRTRNPVQPGDVAFGSMRWVTQRLREDSFGYIVWAGDHCGSRSSETHIGANASDWPIEMCPLSR